MLTEAEKIKSGIIIVSLILVVIGIKIDTNMRAVGITKLVEEQTEMSLVRLDDCRGSRHNTGVLWCDLFLKDKAGNAFLTNLRLTDSEILDLNNMKNDIKFKILKITHETDKHVTCLRKMTLANNYNLVDYDEEYKLSQTFMSCPYLKTRKEYLKEKEIPFEGTLKPWYKTVMEHQGKKLKTVDNWGIE